jgi:surface polysaccharide O-acyltransferase-like enzyme
MSLTEGSRASSAAARLPSRDRLDVELLRAVGALAVVGIHASDAAVLGGAASGPGAYHWTGVAIGGASRFAVPLFFAIAGWVLLVKRPVETEAELWRRVVRVLLPLLSWSLIYVAWPLTPPLRLGAAVGALLGVPVIGHLWFLYAYVALLLVLGMTTLLVQQRWPSRLWLFLGVLAFAAAAPSVINLTNVSQGLLHLRTGINTYRVYLWVLFYAVAGAIVLSAQRGMRVEVARIWGGILFVAGTAGTIWWAVRDGYAAPFDFGSLVVVAECLGVMLLLRGVQLRGRSAEVTRALGRASFGIYLGHLVVLTGLQWLLERFGLYGTPDARAVVLPLLIVATFAISAVLALGWSRSPLFRRWLG